MAHTVPQFRADAICLLNELEHVSELLADLQQMQDQTDSIINSYIVIYALEIVLEKYVALLFEYREICRMNEGLDEQDHALMEHMIKYYNVSSFFGFIGPDNLSIRMLRSLI